MGAEDHDHARGSDGERVDEGGIIVLDSPNLSQKVYLLVMQCIGAGLLDGGINFGLAYVMYKDLDVVKVWDFPDTLAGDCAVTAIVEGALTWVIAGLLVCNDVRIGNIEALSPKAVPWLTNKDWQKKYLIAEDILDRKAEIPWYKRLMMAFARGLAYAAVTFLLFWPITVIILSIIETSHDFSGWPDASIVKGVYGGVMGVIITPPVALISLTTMAAVAEKNQHISTPGREPENGYTATHA